MGFLRRKLDAVVIPGLAAKAAVFGVSWLFLPGWAFVATGSYFYLFPPFRALGMAAHFLIVVFLALTSGKSVIFAVFLSFVFYLILALKDLRFINRDNPRDLLAFSLLLPLFIKLFSFSGDRSGTLLVFLSFFAATAAFFLLKNIFADRAPEESKKIEKMGTIMAFAAAFLIWQLLLVLFFTPLNFIYQSSVALIFSVVIFGLASDLARETISRKSILFAVSVFLVFSSVILGSAHWGL